MLQLGSVASSTSLAIFLRQAPDRSDAPSSRKMPLTYSVSTPHTSATLGRIGTMAVSHADGTAGSTQISTRLKSYILRSTINSRRALPGSLINSWTVGSLHRHSSVNIRIYSSRKFEIRAAEQSRFMTQTQQCVASLADLRAQQHLL